MNIQVVAVRQEASPKHLLFHSPPKSHALMHSGIAVWTIPQPGSGIWEDYIAELKQLDTGGGYSD